MTDHNLSNWKAVKLNCRAIAVWQKLCPGLFLSILTSSVFQALSPYVTIWLSARIIEELAGNRNPKILRQQSLLWPMES